MRVEKQALLYPDCKGEGVKGEGCYLPPVGGEANLITPKSKCTNSFIWKFHFQDLQK